MKVSTLFKALLPVLVVALLLALASATPALTAPQDGKVRVYVEFQPGAKAQVQAALNANRAEFHYTFDELNTFVVSLPQAALEGIRKNPNVVLVEEDPVRSLFAQDVPYGIDMVQARDVWDANRDGALDAGAPTGADRIVCVIDSGLYTAHEDLQSINVIGGYPSNWNTDKCGHGTHVAGTIAAANDGLGVVGVTPGTTSLYIVKVFGDDCAWAYSSDLVDAANRCEAAGADIISMSLGGTFKSRTEENAFNNLYNNKNVLSVAAAGNDGNTRISYPAGYSSVISVAAIDSNKVVADFSQKNSTVELAAPGVGVMSTVPFVSQTSLTVGTDTYAAIHIEYAKYGTATGALVNGGLCDTTGSWSGRVVLCERGVISFYDKVVNVQNSGGVAAVIYNNVSGGFTGTLGEGYSSTIPAISISQEDGQFLVANKLGSSATVDTNPPVEGSGYESWNGTSMATPHVSGVAALLWSYNTSLTNAQIRDAMVKTAQDLGAAGKDDSYGYGLVQALTGLKYLGYVGGGGTNQPPTASFTFTTSSLTATFKDTSSDTDGTIASWNWDFGDGSTSTAQNPSHTYAAGGTYTVTLTVTDNGGATDSASQSVTVSSGGGSSITLSVVTRKVKSTKYADLTWSGATSTSVDIYRNGSKVTTEANDGTYTDSPPKNVSSATYKVCEVGTNTCSNEVTVTW